MKRFLACRLVRDLARLVARPLAWTVLLACAGACDSAERSASPSEPTHAQSLMHHLNVDHPTAIQEITPESQAKFVEVSIGEVYNPSLAAISFSVAFQTEKATLALGSFSLYPADHPGTFIVPTQEKVRDTGRISVTMENPDKDTRIRVTVTSIRLISRADPPSSAP